MITCFCLSPTVALFYDETIPNYHYFNCHIIIITTPSLPLLSLSTHHPSQCLPKATAPASTGGTCRPTCRFLRVPIEFPPQPPPPPPHPLVGSGRGPDQAPPHRIPPHRRPRPPHHRHPRYCCNNHLHPHHLSTLPSNITPSYSSNPLRCFHRFYHYHLITLITTSFITPITTTTLSWRRAAGHSPRRRMKLLLSRASRGGRPQSAAFRRISTPPPPL